MKTTNERTSICHYFNLAWSKSKNVILLLVFLLILFSSINVSAQELRESSSGISKISERKTFLTDMRISEQSARASYSNAQHIESLLSKVQPSVYVNNSEIKSYGEKPICLFTDIQTLTDLKNTAILKNNIEMATITIKHQIDLGTVIDLNHFSEFKNLKYIQIVSAISLSEEAITKMIRNNDGKYSVFFKIQNGDSQ